MTIEEDFFKTFGIDPIGKCNICTKGNMLDCPKKIEECEKCEYLKKNANMYAHITSRILLELICLINKYAGSYSINTHNLDNLQSAIIHYCLALRNHKTFKQQVQKLFEVEE